MKIKYSYKTFNNLINNVEMLIPNYNTLYIVNKYNTKIRGPSPPKFLNNFKI